MCHRKATNRNNVGLILKYWKLDLEYYSRVRLVEGVVVGVVLTLALRCGTLRNARVRIERIEALTLRRVASPDATTRGDAAVGEAGITSDVSNCKKKKLRNFHMSLNVVRLYYLPLRLMSKFEEYQL